MYLRSVHERVRPAGPSRKQNEAAARIGRMLDQAFEPVGLDTDPQIATLLARLNEIEVR